MIRAALALEAGDETALSAIIKPDTVTVRNLLFGTSDSGVLQVSDNKAKALTEGSAKVLASATIDGMAYTTEQEITVAPLEYGLTPARTASGIALARVPETIEVGEEFSAQAYLLSSITEEHPWPYGYYDENLVKFRSSAPSICRVKNGVLEGIAPGTATITVSDLTGTVTETFQVEVIAETALGYTEEQVLTVNAEDYDWTDAETTTLAIQSIMTAAADAGMRKVIFPNQLYTVSPVYGSIYIPTQMIVDFSNAIIQIEVSDMSSTGYQMFIFQDTEYSSIENAVIYGERDLLDSTGDYGCKAVEISGKCFRSGLKNCTVSKSPGFNTGIGNTNRKVVGFPLAKVEAGGIDDTGADQEETYAFRCNGYLNISTIGERFFFGNIQGYQGYLYLSARCYDIFFYDSSYAFLSSLKDCIQYYGYLKPENAVYCRIVFRQASAPTSCDPDYSAIAHIHSMDKPDRCYFKNCVMEDNYFLACSTNGGENFLIDGCTFKNNGYQDPASHLDWEDGRNHNKGHILRNCTFEGGGAVTAVGADGLVVHNNIFTDVPLNIGGEVQNSRVWLNTFIGDGANLTITPKTDEVVSQNQFYDGASYTINTLDGVGFAVRETANNVQ